MPSPVPLSDLVGQIADDVRAIVHDEIALAKAEIKPAVKRVGIGAGYMGAAGYVLVSATIVFWFVLAAGFAWLYSLTPLGGWGAAFFGMLTAVIVLLVVAVVLFLAGKKSFGRVKGPELASAGIGETMAAIGDGVSRGSQRVAEELDAAR